MQPTSTDAKLIAQSRALSAAHTIDEMRDFLRSVGSSYADSTDYGTLAAAILGIAQHNLRVLAGYLTEDSDGA